VAEVDSVKKSTFALSRCPDSTGHTNRPHPSRWLGKKNEARTLAMAAAAKMKPLPTDEQNPPADGTNHDEVMLWLAYKEGKVTIQFDAAPKGKAEGAQ
jgi:hypothetical protein